MYIEDLLHLDDLKKIRSNYKGKKTTFQMISLYVKTFLPEDESICFTQKDLDFLDLIYELDEVYRKTEGYSNT